MTAFIIFTKSATSPSCYRRRRPLFNMGEEGKKLFFFLLYFVCFSLPVFLFRAKMHHFCYLFSIGISLFLMICSPAHSTLNVFLFFFFWTGPLTHSTLTSLHFGVVVARLTVTVINKRVVCRHSHCVPLWNFVSLLLVFGSFGSTALFLAWPTLLFSLLLLCMFLVSVLTGRKAHSFGCNNNMPLTYSLLYRICLLVKCFVAITIVIVVISLSPLCCMLFLFLTV